MTPELQKKMQDLMYVLTKNAARFSYRKFLEDIEISDEDYAIIKAEWKDKLGIVPFV